MKVFSPLFSPQVITLRAAGSLHVLDPPEQSEAECLCEPLLARLKPLYN